MTVLAQGSSILDAYINHLGTFNIYQLNQSFWEVGPKYQCCFNNSSGFFNREPIWETPAWANQLSPPAAALEDQGNSMFCGQQRGGGTQVIDCGCQSQSYQWDSEDMMHRAGRHSVKVRGSEGKTINMTRECLPRQEAQHMCFGISHFTQHPTPSFPSILSRVQNFFSCICGTQETLHKG